MKIENQTHWSTAHLRALVMRVALEELDAAGRRRLVVRVQYRRRNSRVRGRGSYGHGAGVRAGGRMWLFLEREDPIDRVLLAHTIAHECGHLRGLRHPAMKGARYGYADGWQERYAWAETLPLARQPAPPKLSRVEALTERRTTRLTRALTALARWERRAKHAAARVQHWRRRVKAVERTIQQAAKAAEVGP